MGLRRLEFPREFLTPHGDVMTLGTIHDLITAWVIFYRVEYPVESSLRVILDVGANIGSFSLLAARAAPESRIIALEPFPQTRASLESHIARNGLEGRVTCLPWALAGFDGRRFMADESADVPSQSRGLADNGDEEIGIPVEAVTLESLLNRQGLERVDLIKIDIEGSEHEVLLTSPNDVLQRFGAIALEYHPNKPKAPLFDRLRDAGFRPTKDVETFPGSNSGVAFFRRG